MVGFRLRFPRGIEYVVRNKKKTVELQNIVFINFIDFYLRTEHPELIKKKLKLFKINGRIIN